MLGVAVTACVLCNIKYTGNMLHIMQLADK
jgi:hypothetical protein